MNITKFPVILTLAVFSAGITLSPAYARGKNIFTENTERAEKTYMSYGKSQQLDPNNSKDVNELANSVEFEVYEISENHSSHTIFESNAGICRGYQSSNGVELTDSTTYYVDDASDDYYATITGATIYAHASPKNVQYAPIFNIHDPKILKEIHQDEEKYGKDLATKNVNARENILSKGICR
ncbi:hypothetical protein [Basfia succiniciproducens]|uniref:hypothetical protein n=1 Tax=Basfia succiniciproducens TaxID=653940 RepID=UPI003FCE3D86